MPNSWQFSGSTSVAHATVSEYVGQRVSDAATPAHDENTATHGAYFDVDLSTTNAFRKGLRYVDAHVIVDVVDGEAAAVRARRNGDTVDGTANNVLQIAPGRTGSAGGQVRIPMDSDGVAELKQTNGSATDRRVRVFEAIWAGF